MSVAFNGIDSLVVTFQAEQATAGCPVAMADNDKVKDAPAGTAPVGIALNLRGGHAAVQTRGYVRIGYDGTAPALGWASLVAAAGGKLRTAAAGENGRSCLVVSRDTTAKTMGLFL